jgi:hypothetical protein
MTRLGKGLLLVEIAICFMPLSILMGIGVLMMPLQIFFLAIGEIDDISTHLIFAANLTAWICGLTAVYCIMRWHLYGIRARLRPRWVVLLMGIGVTPLIFFFVVLPANAEWNLLAVLPLLCCAHLLWLSRDYLFGDA